MRWIHLIVGGTFVIVFLATGLYMRYRFAEPFGGDIGMRMMYRSAHIYILLSALVNLAVAAHYRTRHVSWRRRIQIIGSFALLLAPCAFTLAFFVEPAPETLARPIALAGVILTLGGTLLHVVASIGEERGTSKHIR